MPNLDLYKKRKHLTVTLANGKSYLLPKEYTVEEVERLLEYRVQEAKIKNASVEEDASEVDVQKNIDEFWNNAFYQLEVIFQSLQPDIDIEYLKKNVTHKEALEIIGFFDEYRTLTAQKEDQLEEVDVKKKLKI